jgi:hypothetical protein
MAKFFFNKGHLAILWTAGKASIGRSIKYQYYYTTQCGILQAYPTGKMCFPSAVPLLKIFQK